MAAPTLTPAEQKAALSKRKKKRILKNVLSVPKYLKVESLTVADSEAEKLKLILERLLPSARLPVQQNLKCKNITSEEAALRETAQLKRKQLSLGVNSLNKSIKKGLISAALLASDIEPKFLIHHLNLLCSHNKIPYLHMVGLREITEKCLGFPCIALGFKNNSDFSEAINEIKALSAGLKKSENCEKPDGDVTTNENITEKEAAPQSDELSFTYLYRSTAKERIFVPENFNSSGKKMADFISVDKCADVKFEKKGSDVSLISVEKKRSRKNEKRLKVKRESVSEQDLEVPRKKPKKDQDVDNVESKQKPRYYSVNLVKVSSNSNRISRKRKI